MGFAMVAWLLVFVWSVDSAAYAAGRSIGGPRLWPTVSPNKTWAGLAGGVLAGAIVAKAFAVWSPGAPIALLGALGAAFAIAEQAGDLIESSVKRHFGVKDTGALIPGHGGLLDRVDGLMLVALAAAALRALGQAYLPAP
jgi:phosphatidate cytidylyltransferase